MSQQSPANAPQPPFHVVATDMDGTLLDSTHNVSAFTKATIQKLIRRYQLPSAPAKASPAAPSDAEVASAGGHTSTDGNRFNVFFVLASGRHVQDLVVILKELELPDYSGYIVSSNGSKVHCIVHGSNHTEEGRRASLELEEVFAAYIPPSQVYRLFKMFPENEDEVNINAHTSDGWICSLDWTDELQYCQSGFAYTLFSPQEKIAEYEAFIADQRARAQGEAATDSNFDSDPCNPLSGIAKLYFGSDNTERLQQMSRVLTNTEESVDGSAATAANPFALTTCFSSKYCLEVTAAGVHKAAGIEQLMPHLQRRSDSAGDWSIGNTCIAFGDGENDEMMLRSAAKSCFMKNANEKLKAILRNVKTAEEVGLNSEDGVAKKLIEVFNLDSETFQHPPEASPRP